MRLVRYLLVAVLVIIALIVAAGVTLWVFNPLAPPVVVADPMPTGKRITDNGLLANYYPGTGAGKRPGILLLGGSEGGIGGGVTRMAMDLQARGYSVLNISYYRGPGQHERLELVPLEMFDHALEWLKAQDDVDGERLAVIGGSKGAEAALIVAARHPELRAAIAGMPSSVAWQGLDWNLLKQIFSPPDGSWSLNGGAIPYVPYVKEFNGTLLELYSRSLSHADEHEAAIIRIERTHAAVLLICGKQDTLWPSCPMAEQVKARAVHMGGAQVTVLAYELAGHGVFGVPVDRQDRNYRQLSSLGGTDDGNNAARTDSWPKVLALLAGAMR
ncbi:MAG: acyl-CoA thioester hydrolase/BAAT C-terminal domain-containing protein [Micropepsaceae bacterium]